MNQRRKTAICCMQHSQQYCTKRRVKRKKTTWTMSLLSLPHLLRSSVESEFVLRTISHNCPPTGGGGLSEPLQVVSRNCGADCSTVGDTSRVRASRWLSREGKGACWKTVACGHLASWEPRNIPARLWSLRSCALHYSCDFQESVQCSVQRAALPCQRSDV